MTSSSGTKRLRSTSRVDRLVVVGVDEDEARQARRHLDPGEVLRAGLGVLQQDGEVEREPGDVGERVGRVDRERGEHGEDVVGEEEVERVAVGLVELVPAHDGDALILESRPHVVLEDRGVLVHQLVREPGDPLDQLARLEAGRGPHGEAGGDPPLEAGDPDHEVLVEVAREDREEAGPLEERHVGVHRELHDPLVELQPGQLTLEVAVGGQVVLRLRTRPRPDEPAVGPAGRRSPGGHRAREGADLRGLAGLAVLRLPPGDLGMVVDIGSFEAPGAHGTIVAPFLGDRVLSSHSPGTRRVCRWAGPAAHALTSRVEDFRDACSRCPRQTSAQARANWRCTSRSVKPRPS